MKDNARQIHTPEAASDFWKKKKGCLGRDSNPHIQCKANAYKPKAASDFSKKKTELPWEGFIPTTSRVLDRCSTN